MRAIRLLTTTVCCVCLSLGAAQASQSIVVNYDVLERLPHESLAPGTVQVILTPLGLVRRHAVPVSSPFAGNTPIDVGNSVPPAFEHRTTLYNRTEPGSDESADAAFGITGATRRPAVAAVPPQQTAMLSSFGQTSINFAPGENNDEAQQSMWTSARTMGEVLFRTNGYDVVDVERGSLSQLDRLAREIGNQRILLRAFGGVRGDDSHEAHLVALKRGLAVRRYLIARGVSSSLIDVTAVGGANDGGPLDRVDVVASNG